MVSHGQKVEIKIEKLCRTCLSKDNELNSLFDVAVGTVSLDFVVAAITGLKIRKGDGLPSTICCECRDKAEKAYDFKKKSQEAHISLRELYKEEEKTIHKIEDVCIKEIKPKGVKMEFSEMTTEGNDDFSDVDYSFPLSNNPDDSTVLDIEVTVKHETSEKEDKVPLFECKKCCLVFDTAGNYQKHKKKKCATVKSEYEDVAGTYCPICGTCYNGDNSLSKHMREFHADLMGPKKRGRPKKVMTTTILNKLSENGLLISTTHGKTYHCSFCKKQTKTKEDLINHTAQHKDMKVLCCILCKRMYLKKKSFNSHLCLGKNSSMENDTTNMQTEKNGKMAFASEIHLQDLFDPTGDMTLTMVQMCTACTGVYLSEADLINHHDLEHPELSLRCNHCTKVFASVRTAARHRVVCKQIERMHKCTTCGLKFAYEISLNKHILRYHQGQSVSVAFMGRKAAKTNANVQYQCDTCHKIFHRGDKHARPSIKGSQGYPKYTISKPRGHEKNAPAPLVYVYVFRKEALAKHAKLHMPNQKLYECDICHRKFNRSDNLRTHKKIHDVDRAKPPANNCLCLYCGRGFSNSSNLIVHMRRHTGEKPYKCDFCGKGFPRSSDLMVHRRSHTGEKPCVCRICGKAFSRSNKLSRHMRVHTGQRPYKCTYCEKAFSQSNDLTLHIRRHTGDKPYVCEVCGERFIQGTALQNHRRAHGHFPPPPPDLANLSNQVQAITYSVSSLSNINLQHETHMPN